ncbi:FMN-dependent 2-nitropropane dioxygenase [Apiospora hydei]|uniref:FMN-dependent 2-nitropropane dioxygenase n=1 Tax=Apiospora hydei TaxID=1337664 RepID=A0ABR1WCI6_9PEZI
MASGNLLHKWFPTAERPLVISAPMFTVANGALAAAVTKAGGLGMVPAGMDPSATSPHLAALDEQLAIAGRILDESDRSSDSTGGDGSLASLPIGVGFLTLLATPEAYRANALPIIRRHRPAFVWLFGSEPAGYGPLIELFREAGAGWGIKVFVQVGTVEAAREVVRQGADVVVAQGSDAGGHQFAAAASVVTLVPEIVDALRGEGEFREGREERGRGGGGGRCGGWEGGCGGVGVGGGWGGDGDSVTGAEHIIRSSVNDAIMGYPTWSNLYAGRTILHSGLEDIANGVSIEQVHGAFKNAMSEGDEKRMITFAGTGVGLANKSQPAGEIVHEVRAEALAVIAKLKANF